MLLLSAALFANIVGTEAFQQQLQKAREEYRNLKDAVRQMDALSGDETRNAAADPQDVMKVQELLNNIGFLCGTPDGIAGRQTTSCVERFQMMYGYEPADGIIDEELITQLTDILSRKQG